MSQYGTFYVVTAKHGVRPNRLKKFLLAEWFTALQSTSGCLDVELWESQRSSGRYLVCELWESQEIYLQNSEKLWNEEKKDVFEKLNLYGMIKPKPHRIEKKRAQPENFLKLNAFVFYASHCLKKRTFSQQI